MKNWEELRMKLAAGPEDLRAEVVVAELLISGELMEDEFFFRNNGGFHRSVARDLENVFAPGTLEEVMEHGCVELNRPGLYDTLPEALFHQSRNSRPFQAVGEMVEEVRRNNEVERMARLFYWPLDHEMDLARVRIELNERQLTQDLLEDSSGRGMTRFWDLPDLFSDAERAYLIKVLPMCHWLVDDRSISARCLSDLLHVPVRLELAFRSHEIEAPEGLGTLAGCQLGVDSLLAGNTLICERVLEVHLGPMGREVANDFSPACPGRAKLDHLLGFFLPADVRTVIRIDPGESSKGVWTQHEGSASKLGVTSTLN